MNAINHAQGSSDSAAGKIEAAGPLSKLLRTLHVVTRAQGLGHALKVAFGPTLDAHGIWRMTSSDRELVFWERQVVGVGSYSAETAQAQLDPARMRS
jgi:hypothetical protein